ncbi:hypothetical protein Pth03_59620 [Planotetraspora thailandica]|uniref:Uncharacterized protein n=1 Tax=Planotetraspora thailandica TaxID=487172 RepID=A0A8J3XZD4_9ACTN|nr:hypothetical protein Pth03_59620 [Planotetraspora thailandica]
MGSVGHAIHNAGREREMSHSTSLSVPRSVSRRGLELRCGEPTAPAPLEWRPIGTNGYVSTWGALVNVCIPQGA